MIKIKEIFTWSNGLSFVRLLLAVPIWFLMEKMDTGNTRYILVAIGVFGALTDYLDGYLARKFNEVTELGKIIDPLADKVVIGTIVIQLFLLDKIPDYYFYMIIGRDIIIFLGGIIVSNIIGKVLPSNMLGKITVANIALVFILIIAGFGLDIFIVKIFYLLSILLLFISLIGYFIRAIEFLKQKKYGPIQ